MPYPNDYGPLLHRVERPYSTQRRVSFGSPLTPHHRRSKESAGDASPQGWPTGAGMGAWDACDEGAQIEHGLQPKLRVGEFNNLFSGYTPSNQVQPGLLDLASTYGTGSLQKLSECSSKIRRRCPFHMFEAVWWWLVPKCEMLLLQPATVFEL